ncbi:recombinase family protein [Halomarina ordinaria]|uniref:Recombinase family protein n=1 Tax=Halomarina ordinaria TaxID=3033939 RepID=A0ABD5UD24_9EURY|nr:recombinase family protein [Halomarina sp. PSRA2]
MTGDSEHILAPQRIASDELGEASAAVYARTSSANQRFGHSIDEQVRACCDRCRLLGWEVTHVFRDEAVSGTEIDRPMFQQMLHAAEAGHFDVLVFWKLDRFSRSIMHAVKLERSFRTWGVALHSATEHLDTTTATGQFNFRNIANAAEFERELIKQRTAMGMKALALEHKWPNSRPPFGYAKRADGRLEIDLEEARWVRWIFETYLEYKSMADVAHMLNDQDVPTGTSTAWTTNTVRTILTNELYVGQYSVADVEDDVPEYRLLDDELFTKAQRVRTRFRRTSGERPKMRQHRKETLVEGILQQYEEYLETGRSAAD